tara:strand:- start:3242 stop:5077 length:1836 start_codon:yes stop_codon:yes gene_type:complete
MTDNIPVEDIKPPEKLYHNSNGGLGSIRFDEGFHIGTYEAAIDRAAGSVGDKNLNKIVDTIDAIVLEKLEFDSEFAKMAEEAIDNARFPKEVMEGRTQRQPRTFYEDTIKYTVTTDKDYTYTVKLYGDVIEDNGEWVTELKMIALDSDNAKQSLGHRAFPENESVIARFIFDDEGRIDDVLQNIDPKKVLTTQSINNSNVMNSYEYFSNDQLYEVKIKPEAKVLELKDKYALQINVDGDIQAWFADSDRIANSLSSKESSIQWQDIKSIAPLEDVVPGPDGLYDIEELKGLNWEDGKQFYRDALNSDVVSYTNIIEDNGSKSYVVYGGYDVVEIAHVNPSEQKQYNIDVDTKQTTTFQAPINLTDIDDIEIEIPTGIKNEVDSRYLRAGNRNLVMLGSNEKDPRLAFFNQNIKPTVMTGTNNLGNLSQEIIEMVEPDELLKTKAIDRIKKRFGRAGMAAATVTPNLAWEAMELFEDFIMIAGLAYAFAPDIDTFVKNKANNMLETLSAAAGYNVKFDDFEYDWQRVNKGLDWIEAWSPTDIVINKFTGTETFQNYGSYLEEKYQVKPATDVKYELGNTINNISTMPKKDEETSDTYDRIAMTFGNYGKKIR